MKLKNYLFDEMTEEHLKKLREHYGLRSAAETLRGIINDKYYETFGINKKERDNE